MRSKRIYLNKKKTKYCVAKLFKKKKQMQEAYAKYKPKDKHHDSVLGVHCGSLRWNYKKNKFDVSKNTGIVFLSLENCGSGIVCHEFMHAIFWAKNHSIRKRQYPVVIKNMEQEEILLHNFTGAVVQFYNWYWKIKKFV